MAVYPGSGCNFFIGLTAEEAVRYALNLRPQNVECWIELEEMLDIYEKEHWGK